MPVLGHPMAPRPPSPPHPSPPPAPATPLAGDHDNGGAVATTPPLNATPPVSPEDERHPTFSSFFKGGVMYLKDLKELKIAELAHLARDFNVEGAAGMTR